jgi:hypothetical protein
VCVWVRELQKILVHPCLLGVGTLLWEDTGQGTAKPEQEAGDNCGKDTACE